MHNGIAGFRFRHAVKVKQKGTSFIMTDVKSAFLVTERWFCLVRTEEVAKLPLRV